MSGKSKKVIEEILSTEVSYVANLEVLRKEYILPLRKDGGALMEDNNVAVLFSNAEQILTLNTAFCGELREVLGFMHISGGQYQLEKNVVVIAELFIKYAPVLALYRRYARSFPEVQGTIFKCLEADKILEDKMNQCRKAAEGKGIDHFLIMPVQRVPRYPLLLRELISCDLDKEGEAYDSLDRALDMLKKAVTGVNEAIRQYEQEKKVVTIQNQFKGANFSLVKPGRLLLLEMNATKISKHNHRKRYRFYLFSDLLMYTKDVKIHAHFELAECAVQKTKNGGSNTFGVRNMDKPFAIEFETEADCNLWARTMQTAIENQRMLRTGTTEPPPGLHQMWDSAGKCSICEGTVGSIFSAKYHCHRCGKVVCGKCSAHRVQSWKLRHDVKQTRRGSQNMERVCDKCMVEIEKQKSETMVQVARYSVDSFSILSPKTPTSSAAFDFSMDDSGERRISEFGKLRASKRLAQAKRIAMREKKYVESLRKVVRMLVRPTQFQSRVGSIDKLPTELALFFNSLEQIYTLNVQLLRDLQNRIETWYHQQPLGEVFIQFGPLFEIYKPYGWRFRDAERILCQKRWARWLEKVETRMKAKIHTYLVLPLDRIQQYRHEVKGLISVTSKFHQDYSKLQDAQKAIDHAALFINSSLEGKVVVDTNDTMRCKKKTIQCAPPPLPSDPRPLGRNSLTSDFRKVRVNAEEQPGPRKDSTSPQLSKPKAPPPLPICPRPKRFNSSAGVPPTREQHRKPAPPPIPTRRRELEPESLGVETSEKKNLPPQRFIHKPPPPPPRSRRPTPGSDRLDRESQTSTPPPED